MLFQKTLLINELEEREDDDHHDKGGLDEVPVHYMIRQKLLSPENQKDGTEDMRIVLNEYQKKSLDSLDITLLKGIYKEHPWSPTESSDDGLSDLTKSAAASNAVKTKISRLLK